MEKTEHQSDTKEIDQLLLSAISQEYKARAAKLISTDQQLTAQLLVRCSDEKKVISGKAWRMLEFICLREPQFLVPYLDIFILQLKPLKKDDKIRSAAKICECLITSYYEETANPIQQELKKQHRQKIGEVCFDWLLGNHKVAPQAYAMSCLQELGTEFPWIHPELKTILKQHYPTKSAGYQARARMVLKKIDR